MARIVSLYGDNELLLARVKIVGNYWLSRFDLLLQRDFPKVDGLLFYRRKSAITFGLRFAVDLIYLDGHKKVKYISEALVPNKFGPYIRDADYLLEMPAGTAAAKNIFTGMQMQW
jgi:Uncharacterized conserved protein